MAQHIFHIIGSLQSFLDSFKKPLQFYFFQIAFSSDVNKAIMRAGEAASFEESRNTRKKMPGLAELLQLSP